MPNIIDFPNGNFVRTSTESALLSAAGERALNADEMLAATKQLRDRMAVVTEYLESLQFRLTER